MVGSTVEVVVDSVLVVSKSSNKFSIFPSRTSISCVSRNCFANLKNSIVFQIFIQHETVIAILEFFGIMCNNVLVVILQKNTSIYKSSKMKYYESLNIKYKCLYIFCNLTNECILVKPLSPLVIITAAAPFEPGMRFSGSHLRLSRRPGRRARGGCAGACSQRAPGAGACD